MSLILLLLREIISLTSIFPSVIVPVLSKHNVSTLARVSIAYKSWTNTLYLDSFKTLIASTVETSNINPSGIIPTTAATTVTTAFWVVLSGIDNCFNKRSTPIGINAIDTYFTILFKERIISEFISFLSFLASRDITDV